MMKKILKSILILFFIIIIGIVSVCVINNPFAYHTHYWDDIGIKGSHLYNDIIREKGMPKKTLINETENQSTAIYDDVQFVWYNTDFKGAFIRAEILSSGISFGAKKVCVGMSRDRIENIYDSYFIKKMKDTPMDILTYNDGGVYVTFVFGEDDTVSKIMLHTGI